MAIVKVMTGDQVANRFQDNVRDTVNPLIQRVENLTPSVVASPPVPSASLVGRIVLVQKPGEAATIRICSPTSDGGFEWVTVGTSS